MVLRQRRGATSTRLALCTSTLRLRGRGHLLNHLSLEKNYLRQNPCGG